MSETPTVTPISRRPEGASPLRARGDRPDRAERATRLTRDRSTRWVEMSYLAQATADLDRQVAAAYRRR